MNTADLLTSSLQLSPSELYVSDIPRMKKYYSDTIGLELFESTADSAVLGYGNTSIIRLVEKPNLAYASPRSAGLFHNAIMFDSRGDLARAAGNTILQLPQTFVGTGDHLVSEAFYFSDPEGNGLELYFDRPQDTWQWQNGQIKMDTLYIDPLEYISKNASDTLGTRKKLGHVHLKVGNIANARQFYVDILGFTVTAIVPGALFISIGGYHHHIALNTWLSEGARLRQPTLGLAEVAITLHSNDDINRLAVRLEQSGRPFSSANATLRVNDPWGNRLRFTA